MPTDFPEFETNRVFYDSRNFPRGFSRSGDFSLKEAELLTRYGALLSDLTQGRMAPANPAQERLLAVTQGQADAEHPLEKVWAKYLGKTSRPIVRYSCAMSSSDGDYYVDDTSDL